MIGEFLNNILKKIAVIVGIILVVSIYVFSDYLEFKDRSVPVLIYHGVGTEDKKDWGDMLITPQLFEKQLQYLTERGYKIMSVEELSELFRTNKQVKKCVALSFDDGYANNYYHAFPLLQKYNATATFYIIKNAVGTDNYMDDMQIEKLLKAGMKVGSHTMSHADLTVLDESQLQRELAGSKMLLGQRYVDYVVESICYPNGLYNEYVVNKCMAFGYKEGVGGKVGVNTHNSYNEAPFEMYRVGVYDRGNGIDGFARTLEKAYVTGYMREKGVNLAFFRELFKIQK